MEEYSKLIEISHSAFLKESEDWKTDPINYLSLNNYSISLLIGYSRQSEYSPFYLRAAALKREHIGASKFIYWAFADNPVNQKDLSPVIEKELRKLQKSRPISGYRGIGWPENDFFQDWLKLKNNKNNLTAPEWDLPHLADYADEYCNLVEHLIHLSKKFDAIYQDRSTNGEMQFHEVIANLFYFDCELELTSLSKKIIFRTVEEYREDPVEMLLKAFENIGLATGVKRNTKKTAKEQASASSTASDSRKALTSQNYRQLENE